MKKDLQKIINHYGINTQLKYMQGEVFELNEAIIKFIESERNPADIMRHLFHNLSLNSIFDTKSNIKDEIADVMVMLKQIQYYYDITDDEITKIMKFKIQRQLDRIAKEIEEAGNAKKLCE